MLTKNVGPTSAVEGDPQLVIPSTNRYDLVNGICGIRMTAYVGNSQKEIRTVYVLVKVIANPKDIAGDTAVIYCWGYFKLVIIDRCVTHAVEVTLMLQTITRAAQGTRRMRVGSSKSQCRRAYPYEPIVSQRQLGWHKSYGKGDYKKSDEKVPCGACHNSTPCFLINKNSAYEFSYQHLLAFKYYVLKPLVSGNS